MIVGDGAAGMTAARALRMADGQAQVTLVSDDPNPAYFRAALTNYLLGELREEQIWATRPEFYDQYRLERLHARCVSLDAPRGQLHLGYGPPLNYDALLLAAGARSRGPTFAGAALHGVMTLRTLQDTRGMMEGIAAGTVRQAVVVGGGPLALECALGMHARGIQVSLIVRGASFLDGTLDAVASDLLAARLRAAGIALHLNEELAGANAAANVRGQSRGYSQQASVGSVTTRTGKTLPCQLVVAAIGVIPNTEWLEGSGVQLNQRRAIIVNDRMQTSLANVYAAGDIVHWPSMAQLWEPAQAQAKVAAANMVGQPMQYAPGVHYMATRLFDLDCASLGQITGVAGAEELADMPKGTGRINYRKLVIKDGKLVGALMLGHREDRVRRRGRWFKRLIDEGPDVTSVKARLLDDGFDVASWLSSAMGSRPEVLESPTRPGSSTRGLTGVSAMSPGVNIAKGAELRGTQAISLTGLLQSGGLAAGRKDSATAAMKSAGAMSGAAATQGLQALLAGGALGTSEVNNDAAAQALGTQVLAQFNLRPATAAIPRIQANAAQQERVALLSWSGQRRELSGSLCRIGRATDSEIRLDDPSVSLVHAHLQRSAGKWYLRDLGSDGGTWVNAAPLVVARALQSGDRVVVGSTELTFHYAGDEHVVQASQVSGPLVPRLEVRSGHSVGLSFELPAEGLVIGRDATSCRLSLDEATWAPQHARVVKVGAGFQITRLSQQGDVWVNQQTCNVGQSLPLAEGHRVHLGHVELAFTQTPIAATSATIAQPASQHWVGGAASSAASNNPIASQPQPSTPPQAQAASSRTTAAVASSGRKMQAFAAVGQPPVSVHAAPVSAYQATAAFGVNPQSAATAPSQNAAGTQKISQPPTLVVQSGPSRGQIVPITGSLTIGSQPGCSWLIQDPTIAGMQAELQLNAHGVTIRNLGPAGSLQVNARDPGTTPLQLSAGDRVQLGVHTTLLVEAPTLGGGR